VTAEPTPYAESPRYETAATGVAPERSWRTSDGPEAEAEAPRDSAPRPAPSVVEPTSPSPPEASPEESSAPARKGWWQRRF
jgi:hypothetical protein